MKERVNTERILIAGGIMIIVLLFSAIIVAHFDEMTPEKYQIYTLIFGLADLYMAGMASFFVIRRMRDVLRRELDLKSFINEAAGYMILMILPPCCYMAGSMIWG